MANFDLQIDFIDYWDEVVRQWLQLDVDSKGDINPNGFDGVAAQQIRVINAINENCKNSDIYKLNTMHMPEPYWGNPLNCSIVLLDYNPAGGPDDNRHTTIKFKDGDEKDMTLIKHVKDEKSYSSFANKCPVFRDAEDLENDGMGWFCDEDNGYEGYHWWQNKRGWLDHLVEAICGKKDEKKDRPLPFGMELCGWHSMKWKNNKWIDKCRDIVDERAIQPLFAAMKNSLKDSKIKIAVCIGAEFDFNMLKTFFSDKIIDVTKKICDSLDNEISMQESDFDNLHYYVSPKSENIHVVAKWQYVMKRKKVIAYEEKQRNYRVFKITDNNEKYYIVNTNSSGSNHHPGEHFWPFEKVLIDRIQKLP